MDNWPFIHNASPGPNPVPGMKPALGNCFVKLMESEGYAISSPPWVSSTPSQRREGSFQTNSVLLLLALFRL